MKSKSISKLLQKAGAQLKKYRYAALILLLGLALLLFPTKKESGEEAVSEPEAASPTEPEASLEERLEKLLTEVDGAGRVRVMLTISRGEETVYQTNETTEQRTTDSGTEQVVTVTTVLVPSGSSTEEALPVTVTGPVYLGAVIVAEGGGLASVRLDLTNAVSSLTGLGADKITVIKMNTD